MNRTTLAAAVAAIVIALGGATSAQADNTYKVDRAEYAAVHLGDSLASVQKKFDAKGTSQLVTLEDGKTYQQRMWHATTTKNGVVVLNFSKANGVWRAADKYAEWATSPWQPANKMTKTEFRTITRGMTLTRVRGIADTSGRITHEWTDSHERGMRVDWPVPNAKEGVAQVFFKWKEGAFRVTGKAANWIGAGGATDY